MSFNCCNSEKKVASQPNTESRKHANNLAQEATKKSFAQFQQVQKRFKTVTVLLLRKVLWLKAEGWLQYNIPNHKHKNKKHSSTELKVDKFDEVLVQRAPYNT